MKLREFNQMEMAHFASEMKKKFPHMDDFSFLRVFESDSRHRIIVSNVSQLTVSVSHPDRDPTSEEFMEISKFFFGNDPTILRRARNSFYLRRVNGAGN